MPEMRAETVKSLNFLADRMENVAQGLKNTTSQCWAMENIIEITENAQKHIAKIEEEDNSDYFRITVLGGGCAGFQYKFDFDKNKSDDDIIIKKEGVSVIIDSTSLELIKGSKIDYVNELIGSSFKISNPHASSSCGCGTSFSI